MKHALFVIVLATTLVAGVAQAADSKPEHCKADAVLRFQGWNIANAQEQKMGPSSDVKFIPHQHNPTRALRQTTYTADGITLCVQKEISPTDK